MAINQALNYQQNAANSATGVLGDIWGQTQQNISPYLNAGNTALGSLGNLAGQTYGNENLNALSGMNQNISANFSQGQVAPTIGNSYGGYSPVNTNFSGYGGYDKVNQQFDPGQIQQDYDSVRNDPMYQFANSESQRIAKQQMVANGGGLDDSHNIGLLGKLGMNNALAADDRIWNRSVGNQGRLFNSQQATANLGLANQGAGLQAQGLRLNAAQAAAQAQAQNQSAGLQAQGLQLNAQNALYGQRADNAGRMYNSQLAQYGVNTDNYNRGYQQQNNLFGLRNQQGQSLYNQQMGVANMGQNAAINNAKFGADYAANYGNIQTGMANAQASGILSNNALNAQNDANQNAMWAGLAGTALGNAGDIYSTYQNIFG